MRFPSRRTPPTPWPSLSAICIPPLPTNAKPARRFDRHPAEPRIFSPTTLGQVTSVLVLKPRARLDTRLCMARSPRAPLKLSFTYSTKVPLPLKWGAARKFSLEDNHEPSPFSICCCSHDALLCGYRRGCRACGAECNLHLRNFFRAYRLYLQHD